jgi:hypothetical protein
MRWRGKKGTVYVREVPEFIKVEEAGKERKGKGTMARLTRDAQLNSTK